MTPSPTRSRIETDAVEAGRPGGDVSPGRILVVDDQEPNVHVISSTLSQLGFEVSAVTSGEKALAELASRPADLVLLDVLMPAMDGFEVCRRIRLQPQLMEIPIIFLSAADDKTFIVRALEAGAVDYVTKPFNRAELTSRVRTHVALKQARDRLRQLAEDKDELLGILAHDLKNHLGGMQMSAQLMHDRALSIGDQRLKRMSANILDASDQMFSFVQEFLANAAADHGHVVKLEPVSMIESAGAALKRYAEAARRKTIALHAALPEEAPLVLADRGALDQVIDNLVSNAVKFSPSDKSIWISVQETGGPMLECRVKDQGPGCDQDDLAHMFTRYRRLTARPTGGEPSTGLGLSIAKRHVDAMNGSLHCESRPGEGAVFVLRLPVAP
ncbi:MAG TPA: hybrid sensor histidine kinase/response regulator [Candidatus Didemnitutus sp.]|nr:hybrid sensor histidine kinase/response regulator [Candidatus Didemnitutus sp.]